MHVLLTNDDGIDAPGLAALEAAVADIATKITVVAPHKGYSGCGHVVTNYEPVRVEQLAERRFKVFGAPADCTRLGLLQLAKDVDLVLAGINAGGNLGVDVYMSGTVAAVREAVWLGTPAIGLSQYMARDRERDWPKSTAMTQLALTELIGRMKSEATPPSSYWNVNLPDDDTPANEVNTVDAHLEPAHLGVSFRQTESSSTESAYAFGGDYRTRPRSPGSDVAVCFGGDISITEIDATP